MFCKSGILIFIFAENNYSIYAHTMLIKTPLLHQSSGPHVFLSLSFSLSLRLFLWSTEALWVHFPARASKTLSRRLSAPSTHREGAWGLREQSKPCVGALLAFCVNQGISTSFPPLLSYRQLRTTRFWSIKGPQQNSIRNMVNNTVITLCVVRWLLDLLWWSVHNMCKYPITK